MAPRRRGSGEGSFEGRGDRAEVICGRWCAGPNGAGQSKIAQGVGEGEGDLSSAAPLRKCAGELEEPRIGEKIRRPRVRDAPDALDGFD